MKCRRGRKRIYSEKLDACIQVETKLFGPSVQVRDLTQTVITDGISIYGALLLHCDIDGVDRVKIDVVRELRGLRRTGLLEINGYSTRPRPVLRWYQSCLRSNS